MFWSPPDTIYDIVSDLFKHLYKQYHMIYLRITMDL